MPVFLNVTNHPMSEWSPAQLSAAARHGRSFVEIPFPHVDPAWGESELFACAKGLVRRIIAEVPRGFSALPGEDYLTTLDRVRQENLIHVMGEPGLVHIVVNLLYQIPTMDHCPFTVVHSTTDRETLPAGHRVFHFVQFRPYRRLL